MLENFKKGGKKIFMAQSQCDKTSVPKERAIKISAHCAKSKTTYCNDARNNRETLIDGFNQCKVSNIRAILKESGRSMTEMLGVLAIIGVLSITALFGYNYAVTKYKANETLDEIAKRSTVVGMEIIQGHMGEFMGEFDTVTSLGYPVTAALLEDPSYFEIQVEYVPTGVCRRILETNWSVPTTINVNGYDYTGDNAICVQNDDETPATMVFQFTADLDENVLPYGACETNADCSGDCIKCENNRCVSTCSGDEKCAQQISTGQMMCCPKNLREGPYCCNTKNNGMCCNTHNQCCPYYKPLIDKDGNCYTCDTANQINVTGVTDNCNVCSNRELNGNMCRLKCPDDKPMRDAYGVCVSCDTPDIVHVGPVPKNCGICTNRVLSPNRTYCAIKCGEGIYKNKPVTDNDGRCHSCDEEKVFSVAAAPENCAACPNRTLIGDMCAPKTCPDGQFLAVNGTCYDCDTPNPISVSGSAELCGACSNRTLGGAWNGFCIIPCGTGIYADKPLMGNGGNCYACDDSMPVSLGGMSASICSVCDGTDTPREISNGFCVIKNICKNNQIKDANGNCHDCDEPAPFKTIAAAVCRDCPNRVPQGYDNIYCSLPCDEGIYEGKPMPDRYGDCHACDEKADIDVFGVLINCSVCNNRIVKGNFCVLNE